MVRSWRRERSETEKKKNGMSYDTKTKWEKGVSRWREIWRGKDRDRW